METKVKTVRKKKSRKIRKAAKYTEEQIVNILKMYNVERMSMSAIAALYGGTRQGVARLVKRNKELQKVAMDAYDPTEVRSRKELDLFERAKLLSSDATDLMEYLLSLSKFKINNVIKLMEDNKETPDIAAKELQRCQFKPCCTRHTISGRPETDVFRQERPA